MMPIDRALPRCPWCLSDEAMIRYHDTEWGTPPADDRGQFEFLMLEAMQCGLSWALMIRKREIFRACFDGFDPERIALYTEEDVARIMEYPGMIRSPRKIRAVIGNARAFLRLKEEHGSFGEWIFSFTGGRTVCYERHETGAIPASNELSEKAAAELRRYGFRYLGPVTVYSHLQACGVINDHVAQCFRYREIMQSIRACGRAAKAAP